MEPCHELFDFALAPSFGRSKDLTIVVARQVATHEADGREVQRAFGEHFENDGELPGGAGRFDAAVGGMLGEEQDLPAIQEHGIEAFGMVQAALFDLGEIGDKLDRHVTLARGEALDLVEEVTIGEANGSGEEDVGLHTSHITMDVSTPSERPADRSRRPGPSPLMPCAE